MNESSDQSRALTQHGGFRDGAGRKPEWFKNKCRQLASSRAFFSFAIKVLHGENVEPKVCKNGIIYVEASVGDKIFLWEKLAAYAYGKPSNEVTSSPAQSVANAEVALSILKLMQEASQFGNNPRTGSASHSVGVDNGGSPPQVIEAPAPSL